MPLVTPAPPRSNSWAELDLERSSSVLTAALALAQRPGSPDSVIEPEFENSVARLYAAQDMGRNSWRESA